MIALLRTDLDIRCARTCQVVQAGLRDLATLYERILCNSIAEVYCCTAQAFSRVSTSQREAIGIAFHTRAERNELIKYRLYNFISLQRFIKGVRG